MSLCGVSKRLTLRVVAEKILELFRRSPVSAGCFRVKSLARCLGLPARRVKNVIEVCSGVGLCQRVPGRGWQWNGGIPFLRYDGENFKFSLERLAYNTLKYLLANTLSIFTMEQLCCLDTQIYSVLTVFAVLGIVKFHKNKWFELTY